MNAAMWSGAPTVSLFVEVEAAQVSLFVRDRGKGFDPEAVDKERRGIAESIRARMARHGGTAVIRSATGQGTEVDLVMPRTERPVSDVTVRHPARCGSSSSTTTTSSCPGCGPSWATTSRWWGRPTRWALPSSSSASGSPTSCSSTCTCPTGAGAGRHRGHRPHPLPEVRFLALSVSDAAEDVIGVIRAGARGYVTKTISGPELTDAVRRVADGDAVFSPRLAGFVLDAFAADPDAAGGATPTFDPELDQLTAARARGAAPDRPRLRLQGGGPRAVHLGQDGGERTCPRCCASCSSPAGTSSPAGPPSAGCCDAGGTRPQGSRRTMVTRR